MRKCFFLLATLLIASFAVPSISGDVSIEFLKANNTLERVTAVPIVVHTESNIRCEARLTWRSSGYHGRCPYGRVVTGVQINGDLAILECAEVKVNCRQ